MATHDVLPRLSQNESPTPPGPHRRWMPWVLMAAFAVIAVLGWRAANRRRQEEQTMLAQQARAAALRPVPVAVATVEKRDFPVYLTGLGSVTAYNTVTVQTRVTGQIMKIFFTEGDHVRAGQMLAQIDPRPYQVQLQQAQGQLDHDEAQLRDAILNQNRDKALWADQVIPRQQLDTQNALVAQYEGSIVADKAQINTAKLNLTYCQITAPIAGKAGLRMVDVGNIVQPSTPGLVVITQMQPIAVIFTLPEEQLAPILQGLRQGQPFRVEAWDRADQRLIATGELLATDNRIDQTTGTLRLKASFANRDERLFPNQFVNVHIQTEVRHNALVAPAAALQHGTQGNYVFVVDADRTVRQRPVDVEMTQGNFVVFRSGVQAGETVITDGQDKLRNGSHIIPQASPRAGQTPQAAGEQSS